MEGPQPCVEGMDPVFMYRFSNVFSGDDPEPSRSQSNCAEVNVNVIDASSIDAL